jgi:predicted RNA binding protein YcfA (HicA-like mRNA interferase family)
MTRLPRVSGRQCCEALGRAGFVHIRQHGSHIVLRRLDPLAQLVVPDHRELDRGTLRAILRHADVSVEEFVHLLGE